MNRHERRKNKKSSVGGGAPQLSVMSDEHLLKLRKAVEFQKSGDTKSAEKIYHDLLKKYPNNPDCLNLLGIAARNKGNPEEAEKLIRKAIKQSPSPDYFKNLTNALMDQHEYTKAVETYTQYLSHTDANIDDNLFMANMLHRMGEFEDALTYVQKCLIQNPLHPNTLNQLAAIRLDMGEIHEALAPIQQALDLEPENSIFLTNLGLYFGAIGDYDKAREIYKQALEHAPDNVDAEQNLAAISPEDQLEEALEKLLTILPKSKDRVKALRSIASITLKLGRTVEALDYIQQVMALTPKDPYVLTLFAQALTTLKRYDDAITYVEAAISIDPLYCDAYVCYGEIHKELTDYEFSTACYAQALTLKPGDTNIITNIGVVLYQMGHLEKAEEAFQRVFEVNPNSPLAHYNYAFLLLMKGRAKEGWEEYSWRYQVQGFWASSPLRHFPQPKWNGEPLKGKRILLWAEQGLGDEILFANTIPDVLNEGGEVHIECAARLKNLFQHSFPKSVVHESQYKAAETGEDHFDYHIALPDLCALYRTKVDDFPSAEGFLKADAARVASLRMRLNAISDRPKIGISWRSMVTTHFRQLSYAHIKELAPIFDIKGVDFINLQYGDCKDELADIQKHFGIELHDWDDIDLKDDQEQLAALMKNMDVVIGPANAPSQLAGALGVPTCLFLPSHAWTMLGTEGMPWFPTMKTFIKAAPEDTWEEPFSRIAAEIHDHLGLSKS